MWKQLSFLFALSLFFINSRATNSTCHTDRCANGPEIRYPFWLSHGSPPEEYCGYREFGLICDNGYPVFSPPPGLWYYVKEIDYVNQGIHLVDCDIVNQSCPRALHKFPIGSLPLSHSPLNLNLSFYYNCSSHPSGVSSIRCLRDGAYESFVFFMGNETSGFQWGQNCEENVLVTVFKDQVTSNGLMDQFAAAMNEGFLLDWQTASDCKECEASAGFCGYNSTAKEILCYCKDGSVKSHDCNGGGGSVHLTKLHIGLIATGGIGAVLTCIVLCYFRRKLFVALNLQLVTKDDEDIEALIRKHGPLSIKRYTFSDVKKITNSFEIKIGGGGYGVVYKGYLIDGCPVAVKILNASQGNGEEFINEVVSMSRTSHVNVVNLLGFCLETHKKAIIYEYMPNGSLEKFIYNKDSETNPPLSWERLHQVAEGIARGLEYLHRGCNTRILHFDIKPSNILLDKNFCPKISDFGLAKLCSKTNSIISMLDTRGTIGYIAPEVWNRTFGGVSHKSDVYSYGMMILEMAGGKQNMANKVNDTSEIYFPHWIYRHVEVGSNVAWNGATTIEENEIARKMITVGLWCIQTIPSNRPTMSRVIEMLEGSLEQLEIPPKPFIFSPQITEVKSSTASGKDSSSSCILTN